MSFAPGTADLAECTTAPACPRHGVHDYEPWLRAKKLDRIATEKARKDSPSAPESTKLRRMNYQVRPILVERQ